MVMGITMVEFIHVPARGREAVMMWLAWKSLEARIKRDPVFRRQMIETYRKAIRDNPELGEELLFWISELHELHFALANGCGINRFREARIVDKTGWIFILPGRPR